MVNHSSYTFPVEFRDVHYIALLYRGNPLAVHAHLSHTRLKPALLVGNKPLVAVGLIQYKDSDLGAYNEMIIAIPVVPTSCDTGLNSWLDLYSPQARRKIGQYILHIPVTTQQSVDAGRSIWGYPKNLLPIEHQLDSNHLHSILFTETSLPAVKFSGSLGVPVPVPSMNLMTYSELNNQWMKTWVDVNANMKCRAFSNVRIHVENKNSLIAQSILELEIADQRPFLTLEATRFKAHFHAPRSCIIE